MKKADYITVSRAVKHADLSDDARLTIAEELADRFKTNDMFLDRYALMQACGAVTDDRVRDQV